MTTKKWKITVAGITVILGLLALGFAAMSTNPPFIVPNWVPTLFFILAGICFVALVTYLIVTLHHEDREPLDENSEDAHQKRIEKAEEYLPDMEKTLYQMKGRLKSLALIAAEKHVDQHIVEEILQHLVEKKITFPPVNAFNQVTDFLTMTSLMDSYEIGLEKIKNSDAKWLKIVDKLEHYPKPDGILVKYIEAYKIILDGAYNRFLFNQYLINNSRAKENQVSNEKREAAISANSLIEVVTNIATAKVSKRIQELLNGDKLT